MAEPQDARQCPYCKEDIKPDAIKCKHCGSRVTSAVPAHEGICPYCKEEIHPEAVRCKHCKSTLNADKESDCGCGHGSGHDHGPSFSEASTPSEALQGVPFLVGGGSGFGGGGGLEGGLGFGCRLVRRCGFVCIPWPWGGSSCFYTCGYVTVCD